ncbi:S-adenosyl-L-methionine-dependent methyltransferase [Ilyonectria sp. MPI-CAGE-AT-0026]|nr:S-adenosyl-L-methionine-dependent methyltransferase [Ilyonectria sp. MPI-CAGE-AT-0026]
MTSHKVGELQVADHSISWDEDDTKSLSSSVLKYTWENGRRYHAYRDGAYWGPNDERQLDTEDFMHSMFLTILDGRLYVAPISKNPQKVLDVGCGTGIWTMQASLAKFAQQHESAEVIGIDLSPVQPSMVPMNVRFEVDDVNLDWTYPKDHFDFVHIRMLTGSITSWPDFHRKVLKHLSPGGWVEQVELGMKTLSDDGTVTPDMPFSKWEHVFTVAGEQMGKTFLASDLAADAMRQAGFQNVNEMRLKLPIGRWPRHETLKIWGTWCRAFLADGLEGFGLRMMTGVLGWSYEETQVFLADMKRHLMNPKIHGYVEMVVAYGQKPPGTTQA